MRTQINADVILLDDILEAKRDIVVDFQIYGQPKSVPITYNPSNFTPELEAKINADNSENLGDSFLLLLEPLFVDWGIKLPPKKKLADDQSLEDLPEEERADYMPTDFPPTKDNLAKLPFATLSIFVKAIMEDIVPKKANTAR